MIRHTLDRALRFCLPAFVPFFMLGCRAPHRGATPTASSSKPAEKEVASSAAAQSTARPQSILPPKDAKSASSNVPGAQYPKIDPERRAWFRMSATGATNISVTLPGGRGTRDSEGMWTITTSPLAPGFHYYSLVVDGAAVADPASDSFFGTGKMSSGIEVPSPDDEFYSPKDVPHGDVRAHYYFSKSTGKTRRCFVYCPPDYDTNLSARYPVLYLQHGMGEDARGWPVQGRTGFIMDNLIAEGKARPMLVVMEDGGITPGSMSGPRKGGGPAFWDGFEKVLIEDVIPMIDETYRTMADREHRGLAGLSLGGTQTMEISQAHLDQFAYIGVFSAPFGFPQVPGGFKGLLGDPAAFAQQVNVLFLSYGKDGDLASRGTVAFHQALEQAGIKHVYYESPGTAHEWLTWRRSLHEFAPLLFQAPPEHNP